MKEHRQKIAPQDTSYPAPSKNRQEAIDAGGGDSNTLLRKPKGSGRTHNHDGYDYYEPDIVHDMSF